MNEATLQTFTRHYKYKNKIDEGGFLTKYFLNTDPKSFDEPKPNPSPIKPSHEEILQPSFKPFDKLEKS
jgi:hypothetical protein